jgi:hypothetical protein
MDCLGKHCSRPGQALGALRVRPVDAVGLFDAASPYYRQAGVVIPEVPVGCFVPAPADAPVADAPVKFLPGSAPGSARVPWRAPKENVAVGASRPAASIPGPAPGYALTDAAVLLPRAQAGSIFQAEERQSALQAAAISSSAKAGRPFANHVHPCDQPPWRTGSDGPLQSYAFAARVRAA